MCALAKESELMKYGWKVDMHVWIISCCCFNHIHNMFSNVKGVIVDFTKKLLIGICITLLLLCLCMTLDYADDRPVKVIKNQTDYLNTSDYIKADNGEVVAVNKTATVIVGKHNDVIHTIKPKHPVIGMYAKPSCGCRYSYTWHYREFINYCPNCGHYGTLRKNPKGVPEREYTCQKCSSDFCGCCGKEKYSWSRVYLRKC